MSGSPSDAHRTAGRSAAGASGTLSAGSRPGPKDSGLSGGRTLIYGLGKSGIAAARLLARHGLEFDFYDDRPVADPAKLSSDLDWSRIQVFAERLPEQLPPHPVVVVSPGVPARTPTLTRLAQAGRSIISEIELAFRFADAPVIAVTGTNGKTTTVTMIDQLLKAAGKRSILTGNIGYPFSTAVQDPAPDVYVLEISSFQLYYVDRFHPHVAVITSFAPNHLDWHPDEEDYFRAKMNITRNLGSTDFVVVPAGNQKLVGAVQGGRARVLTFGTGGDVCYSAERKQIELSAGIGQRTVEGLGAALEKLPYDFRAVSEAFQAAAAVAAALELPAGTLGKLLEVFRPLAHRIERIATKGGVEWINDSKSTSVDATVFALAKQSSPVVLLMGGHDKGLSYGEIATAGRGRIKALVAFGEAREKIAGELSGALPTHQAAGLAEAVECARKLAVAGDVVLLSPACSSYDQFKNYEERGDTFRRLVEAM